MPGCANGAVPTPEFAGAAVAIQSAAIGATMLEFVAQAWPAAAATAVLAQIPVTRLCELNPSDPGDFQIQYLYSDLTAAFLPGFESTSGTMGWWIFQKALYAAFSQYCRCNDAAVIPPPVVATPPPSSTWVYPPGPDNQPQLTRIEDNQTDNATGLKTLYHLGQFAATSLGDLRVRLVQNNIWPGDYPWFTMSGEGRHQIADINFGAGATTRDCLGLYVELLEIPPTVRRRGTTYQRLYGVGSVEWDVSDPRVDNNLIAQRDSLHYETQFLHAPQYAQTQYVRWRLQPGVVAQATQIVRSVDNPFYVGAAPYDQAYQYFDNWRMPAGWYDEPFYPRPARVARLAPRGSPP